MFYCPENHALSLPTFSRRFGIIIEIPMKFWECTFSMIHDSYHKSLIFVSLFEPIYQTFDRFLVLFIFSSWRYYSMEKNCGNNFCRKKENLLWVLSDVSFSFIDIYWWWGDCRSQTVVKGLWKYLLFGIWFQIKIALNVAYDRTKPWPTFNNSNNIDIFHVIYI
jgi:hypothetical protein